MTDYVIKTAEPRFYLYAPGEAPLDPAAMGPVIGAGLGRVHQFVAEHAITPTSAPMVLYTAMDPARMVFRAGVFIDPADAAKAAGEVYAGQTPAGRLVRFTHVGPYETLGATYEAVMARLAEAGLSPGTPSWEIYIDDPETTPPERLRTEISMSLA